MNTTNQQEARCEHCGLFFISKSQVDRHIAKRHGPVNLAIGWATCAGSQNQIDGKPCGICGNMTHNRKA